MLGKTLQRIIDQKHTTARELGDLAGVSPSTVYRWIAGQSQPDFDSIRLLVRHLPDTRAQQEILQSFTVGTDWHCTRLELDLDFNDDGCVDCDDALDASIEAVRGCADSLSRVRGSAHKPMDADETLEVLAILQRVVSHCTITERVLVEMHEQRQKRKLRIAK